MKMIKEGGGGVGFGICRGPTRESEKRWMDSGDSELWVGKETRTREGMTCLTTIAKRKEKRKTSCYIVRVLRVCALAGMGILRKNKGIKENEVEKSWIASTNAY